MELSTELIEEDDRLKKIIKRAPVVFVVYSIILFIIIATNPFWQNLKSLCEWYSNGFAFQCFAVNPLLFFTAVYIVLSIWFLRNNTGAKIANIVTRSLNLFIAIIIVNGILIAVALEFGVRANNSSLVSYCFSDAEIWRALLCTLFSVVVTITLFVGLLVVILSRKQVGIRC